jgi:Protein of unknown function (DUF4232)
MMLGPQREATLMMLGTQRAGLFRRAITRAVPCCALAIGLASAVSACGSMSAGGTAADTGKSKAAAASCSASGLRVTLDVHAAGAAAGTSFVPLDFTNISRGACRLAGYPVVSFATGASGRRVGMSAALDRSVKVRSVQLAPGATAHAWLQVSDAQNYPARRCHPVTAGGLRVDLPGQRGTRFVSHAFPACSAAMHGSQILTVQPIQPGRARRGTAQ